jgi:hypothetical protein
MARHKTSLFLSRILFVVAAATVLLTSAAGVSQRRPVEFELYSADSNMGRTNLVHDETATARPVVMKQGSRVFQVFIDKRTGRELFRIDVGTSKATYWVYGLVREADFNGDGLPDFSWHGGDDVSDKNLVVLSSPKGYRKLDVEASLRGEWKRRFPAESAKRSLMDEATFSDMKLVRQSGKLVLQGIIRYSDLASGDGVKNYEHLLRVNERDFVYVK